MLLSLVSLLTVILGLLQQPAAPRESRMVPASVIAAQLTTELTATSSFLIDLENGAILQNQQADTPLPLASITKLMSALIILDQRPDFSRFVAMEGRDLRRGDVARVMPGEEISLHAAWDLMLVSSSNDATALLARAVAGSEEQLVAAMNAKAQTMGLWHTHFIDATGLDPGNVSTAREIAVLARLALGVPAIAQTVRQEKIIFVPRGKPARTAFSTDQLLRWFHAQDGRVWGGKTGHIEESGYNLVFGAERGGHDLIGVVLGSASNASRFSDMSKLMSRGFKAVRESSALGD